MDVFPLHTTGLLLVSSSPRCHRQHAARKCPISTSNQHGHQPFRRPVDTPEIGQDDCPLTQSILDDPPPPRSGHGHLFTGWIVAGDHWWTVRHSARQNVGVKSGGHVGWGAMQTTAQRPPRGWESARRQQALDEPFASGVRLSWLSQSESSLAEPSAHASLPIHTKDIPTISLCRRLRRCSPEKQVSRSCSPVCFVCLCPNDLASLPRTHCAPILSASHHGTDGRCEPSSSKHNGAGSLEESTLPRLSAPYQGSDPSSSSCRALVRLASHTSHWPTALAVHRYGAVPPRHDQYPALIQCIQATARGRFMAHSSCQTPETKAGTKSGLRRSNGMLAGEWMSLGEWLGAVVLEPSTT